MAAKTVKIPAASHAKLVGLAATRKRPMGGVLADLIGREERRAFLEGANEDFARLRANPEDWADYQAEFRSMEGTMMDGLEDDPWVEPEWDESTSSPAMPRSSTDAGEGGSPWRR